MIVLRVDLLFLRGNRSGDIGCVICQVLAESNAVLSFLGTETRDNVNRNKVSCSKI